MKITTFIVFLCATLSHSELVAQTNGPVIFKSQVVFDGISQNIFQCQATNADWHEGDIWIFEYNTSLLSTNWGELGAAYYVDAPANHGVPYASHDYPISNSEMVFIRMRQVGTNYTFYTNFDYSNLSEFDSAADF